MCPCAAQGTRALAEALKVNTSITHLSLEQNEIEDADAAVLAQALHENLYLRALDLAGNEVGDQVRVSSEGRGAGFARGFPLKNRHRV